jgi:hypothetical protein
MIGAELDAFEISRMVSKAQAPPTSPASLAAEKF